MTGVEIDEKEMCISIPTQEVPKEGISKYVEWVKVEATVRRNQLFEEDAWRLSGKIKSDCWERPRFPKAPSGSQCVL